jgi:general stress protein YciG
MVTKQDKDTRQQQQDKGDMSVREAGKKGGKTTASTHGREFYQDIGKKGGDIGGPRVRELIEEGKKAERK